MLMTATLGHIKKKEIFLHKVSIPLNNMLKFTML